MLSEAYEWIGKWFQTSGEYREVVGKLQEWMVKWGKFQ